MPTIGWAGLLRLCRLFGTMGVGTLIVAPAWGAISTFAPVADTEVRATSSSTNYGAAKAVGIDGSPVRVGYLRFNVSIPSGQVVTKATLRLFAKSSSTTGLLVHQVASTAWGEMTTTYSNAPAIGAGVASSGAHSGNAYVSLNVSSYVKGNGLISFAVRTTSTYANAFNSRHATSNQPQLVVETTSTSPPVVTQAGSLPVGSANYAYPTNAIFVSVSGSDTASGSAASPLRTLARAIAIAPSGRTIVLRKGSYHESVEVPSDKALTIQAFPLEAVWLDGSRVITGWVQSGSTWICSGWTPEFNSTPGYTQNPGNGAINPSYPMASHPDQMWLDGSRLVQVSSAAAVTAGKFYVDYPGNRLVIGNNPSGHEVRSAALGIAITIQSPNSILRGIGVRRYATAFLDIGMVRLSGNNNLIENVVVQESANTGLTADHGTGITISRVTAKDNGMLGVHANYTDNLRVVGLLATGNNIENFNYKPVSGGIKISRSRVVSVQNSDASHNAGVGVWFDESTYKPTLTGSTVEANLHHGVSVEISSTAVIANNIIVKNANVGVKINNVDRARVWNNNVSNNKRNFWIAQDARRGANLSDPGHDPRQTLPDPTMPWINRDIEVANNIIGAATSGSTAADIRDYSGEFTAAQMIKLLDGNRWTRVSTNSELQWWTGSTVITHKTVAPINTLGEGSHNGEVDTAANPLLTTSPQPLPSDIAAVIGQTAGTIKLGNFTSVRP